MMQFLIKMKINGTVMLQCISVLVYKHNKYMNLVVNEYKKNRKINKENCVGIDNMIMMMATEILIFYMHNIMMGKRSKLVVSNTVV